MWKENKGTGREINELQALAAQRNYDAYFLLGGIREQLGTIKSHWRGLKTGNVNTALADLQYQIDQKWQKERAKLLKGKK